MSCQISDFNLTYLDEILALWNQQLVYDPISKERFLSTIILDENFDPAYFLVALEEDEVIGFAYGVKRKIPYLERGLEPHRGWINMVAVKSQRQRQKTGTRLVNEMEKRFKDNRVSEITLCAYSPNYFTPGIDERYEAGIPFFESLHYSFTSQAVSMKRDLWDYQMPAEIITQLESLKQEGITIKRFHADYSLSLLIYLQKEFGGGWKRNALKAMEQGIAEKTIFLVVDKYNEILGFVMRKIDGSDARFGPIGVTSSLRSKGLGAVLLHTMMNDMRQRQIYSMYFLWTSGAAQKFYERHDFDVCRSYNLYKKVI